MSTSSNRVTDLESPAGSHLKPSAFLYREAARLGGPGSGAPSSPGIGADPPDSKSREQAARQAGRAEGEAAMRAHYEENLARVRDGVRAALADFAQERAAYYGQVEAEVVQLALALARKILHREAQVDPLLLAGVVRVALEQMESNTKVVVRVNPEQAPDARAYLQRTMDAKSMPEVVDDPALELDRCVLQTELGTAEVGIAAQLKEIEQGLLDLLAKRPHGG